MFRVLILAAAAVCLASCATPYQQQGLLGGFEVQELRSDVYRISFQGNGYTTRESVQVYWLNRCAELALEKGFKGFEILSDMQFVMRRPSTDDRIGSSVNSSVLSQHVRISASPDEVAEAAIWRDQGNLASRSLGAVQLARGGGMVIFYGGGASMPKPGIEGDVRFISTPVESAPPKIFNASALRAQLEPLLTGEKCGVGNVCPHVHEYLLPKGKLR